MGSNDSFSCFTCTLDGKLFELDTTIRNGCCWNLCSDCSASSTLSLSSFSSSFMSTCFVSGALMTEVITVPDGWDTTCELLGENVTTGVLALKDGDEATLTVPLQIVCTLLVSTCWTCAGLSTIEEGGETGFWDCSMMFSLRTVMGWEVGMACKMNFCAAVTDAGSVLAITVVRGTVWSVTVCSCWFPGETTTGTWVGVCKVLLRLEKIIGSEHLHAEFWKNSYKIYYRKNIWPHKHLIYPTFPKEVAESLLIKQELDLTPELSKMVPKVKVPCVNNTAIAKLNCLPLRHSVVHQETWESHPRPPSQALTNIKSTTH